MLRVAIAAAAAAAAAAQAPTPVPTQDPSNWDQFNALFEGWELFLPTVNVTTNKTRGDYVALRHADIRRVSAEDISILPGGNDSAGRSIAVTVTNLTLSLDALVDIKRPPVALLGLFPAYNVSITNANVSVDLQIVLDLQMDGGVPTAISLPTCSVATPVLELDCKKGYGHKGSSICTLIKPLAAELPGLVTFMANKYVCGLLTNMTQPDGKIGKLVENVGSILSLLQAVEATVPGPLKYPMPQGVPPQYKKIIDKAEGAAKRVADKGGVKLYRFDANGAMLRAADLLLDRVWGGLKPGKVADRTWPGELVIDEVLNRLIGSDLTLPLGVSFNEKILNVSDVGISLVNLTVSGIDRISKLDVARAVSDYTLAHSIGIDEFGISMWLNLTFTTGSWVKTKQSPKPGRFTEMVMVKFTAHDIVLDLITTFATDEHKFSSITIGDLMDSKGVKGRGMIGCLLQPFVLSEALRSQGEGNWCGISLPGLNMRIGDVTAYEMSVGNPGWGPGVDSVLRGVVGGIVRPYEKALLGAFPLLTDMILRPILNTTLTMLVGLETEAATKCYEKAAEPVSDAAPEFVRFNNGSVQHDLLLLNFVVEALFAPDIPNGAVAGADRNDAGINAIIRAVANQTGKIVVRRNGSTTLFDYSPPSSLGGITLGDVHVSVANLSLTTHNMTGGGQPPPLGSLYVMQPTSYDPYRLDNTIRTNRGTSLNVSVDIGLDWTGLSDSTPIHNHFTLTFWTDEMDLDVPVHVQVERAKIDALTLGHAVSPSCLLTTLGGKDALRLPNVQIAGKQFGALLVCQHCSSAMLQGQIQETLASAAGTAQITKLLDGLLKWVGKTLDTEPFHNVLDEVVAGAQCPAPAPQPKNKSGDSDFGTVMVYLVVAGMCVVALIVMLCIIFSAYRTCGSWEAMRWGDALHCSDAVPTWARFGVPFALVASFALFVSSHSEWGIEADIVLHLAGDKVTVKNLFHYDLKTAVGDMWNAGVYPLSLLIGVMSGGWPYVKIMMLAFFWYMPPSVVGTSKRGRGLLTVDYLGKWSLVDMFVFVMFVVAFRLHIVTPGAPQLMFIPQGAVVVDLFIVPHWGMLGFVLAAVLTLATNHYQVFAHKNAVTSKETEALEQEDLRREEEDDAMSEVSAASHVTKSTSWINSYPASGRESLCMHKFDEGSELTGLALPAKILLTTTLVISFCLMIYGAAIDTFSFSFQGIVAPILEWCQKGSSTSSYGVFTLAHEMVSQASGVSEYIPEVSGGKTSTYMSYYFIGATFLIFTIIVPIIQVLSLLFMWLAPLTLVEQKVLLFMNGVLAAWSSTEVFIVSLLAALLEIGQFATFLIGGKCDGINKFLKGPGETFGIIDALGDPKAKCFDVGTKFKTGVFVLFASIFLANVAYVILLRVCGRCILHREQQFREGPHAPLLKPKRALSDGDVPSP